MQAERPSPDWRETTWRWSQTGRAVSKIAGAVVWRGAVPAGVNGLRVLRREGRSELHWKVLGDALARSLQGGGPLLSKLGQVLAGRTDVFPETLCRRLEVLCSGQEAMSAEELERALAEAFPEGSPFEELSPEPIGVGSVGQAHRARLAEGGQQVVVKLLRPGVEEQLRRDLTAARTLLPLLTRLKRRDRERARRALERALEELSRGLLAEVDLSAEAEALTAFHERLGRRSRVYVPKCYRELSSKRVLVMEALEGEPLSVCRERLADDPRAAKRLASEALREVLRQVFEDGHFHADPHAGNLLVLEDGRLGLVDLGLTGEFGPEARRAVSVALRAFLARDPRKVIQALLTLGTAPDDLDLEGFEADVLTCVRGNAPEKAADGAQDEGEAPGPEKLVNELLAIARRHEIEIPGSTTLLIKSLVTIEGVARSLDPELDLARTALPVILKSMRPRWLDRLAFWRRS
jgi:ubiquinone biosynthesis protein